MLYDGIVDHRFKQFANLVCLTDLPIVAWFTALVIFDELSKAMFVLAMAKPSVCPPVRPPQKCVGGAAQKW